MHAAGPDSGQPRRGRPAPGGVKAAIIEAVNNVLQYFSRTVLCSRRNCKPGGTRGGSLIGKAAKHKSGDAGSTPALPAKHQDLNVNKMETELKETTAKAKVTAARAAANTIATVARQGFDTLMAVIEGNPTEGELAQDRTYCTLCALPPALDSVIEASDEQDS